MTGAQLPHPPSPNPSTSPTASFSSSGSAATAAPTTSSGSAATAAPTTSSVTASFYCPQRTDENFSFYCSLLQDSPPPDSMTLPSSHKRKKPPSEHDSPATSKRGKSQNQTLAHVITSIVSIENEPPPSDNHDISAALDSHHTETTSTMLNYYSTLQSHFSDLDNSDSLRSRCSRHAASSLAASASSAAAEPSHQQPQQQRRLWVKDRSKEWWEQYIQPDFPEQQFRQAFRMGRATFDMICDELGAAVAKEDTMLRSAIPVPQRVAVCVWRLATGEPLRVVSKRFGLGISTCHKLVLEVCAAIKTVLMPKFLQWPDPSAILSIKRQFESTSGIPNVIGSIYTTHIPIIAPKISVAAYFNRRHTERNQKTSYSITVQGVVDPSGVFTDVCIGWPGSMPDEQVLEKSALYHRFASGSGSPNDQWVVGGASYPLTDWVLVPYEQQNLTWTQHAFNEKIAEVQRVAREAFARLKGRWKCLQRRTEVKLQDLPVVLGACCVLHNVCELRNEAMEEDLVFQLLDDEMIAEEPVRSAAAKKRRDNIAHMLLHHGFAGTTFFP